MELFPKFFDTFAILKSSTKYVPTHPRVLIYVLLLKTKKTIEIVEEIKTIKDQTLLPFETHKNPCNVQNLMLFNYVCLSQLQMESKM